MEHRTSDEDRFQCVCGADNDERYSLGIYAGRYCDAGWKLSGYRDEGAEGFDQDDAGESYEAESDPSDTMYEDGGWGGFC